MPERGLFNRRNGILRRLTDDIRGNEQKYQGEDGFH